MLLKRALSFSKEINMKSIHYFCEPVNKFLSLHLQRISPRGTVFYLTQRQSSAFLTKIFGNHGNQGRTNLLWIPEIQRGLTKKGWKSCGWGMTQASVKQVNRGFGPRGPLTCYLSGSVWFRQAVREKKKWNDCEPDHPT